MRPRILFHLILTPICAVNIAHAQNATDTNVRRPIPAVKTDQPPKIDGDLSDPAWQSAPKATVFWDRQNGGAAADQTTAWILYDDKYIYVAFSCKDRSPDQIVARETVRDQKYSNFNDSEDNVEVELDPFLTRNGNDFARFSVNPLGTPSARISGGRANKAEWKGDWDAAAKRVPDGWTAEMRIPWAILSYPSAGHPVTMGINFWRYQERTKTQSVWSNVGQQRFNEWMGLWTDVPVPRGAFHPTLSLLPYLMPGIDRSRLTLRSGLDARYTITPELISVGTINPDFATIEGAVESIQFSRAEQFVPERRPFFLEGRDYFDAGQDYAIGPYFYSNRIETFDVGAKIYGKIAPADTLGVLNTVDIHNRNDVVSRYRHDFSPTQSAGFFFTQRTARNDNNTAGFLLHNARWGKVGTETNIGFSGGQAAGGDAHSFNLFYQDKNYFTSLLFMTVAPKFRDANGLIFFTDDRGISSFTDWSAQWRHGFWRDFDVSFGPRIDWHFDGRPFRSGGQLDVLFETRSDWRFRFSPYYQWFNGQIDNTYTFVVKRGVSNRFREWGLIMTTGKIADRPYSFIGPEFSFRTLRKLDIAYGGALQNLDGSTQQHILTMNYELSPTRSFGGRVVVQNADTNWYLSYRNSGAKGTEVFFIIGDPNAQRFSHQARVKFVMAI